MTTAARIGVIGLARSGRAAAKLALAAGSSVFASDVGDGEAVREAASEIRRLGGDAETGGHTVERLVECDLIVLSPGVPPDAAILTDERLATVPWTSELEFAFRHLDRPVIAVTGTNGKTTVTAWIAHLLRHGGLDATAAGNIGTPLSEIALRGEPRDWVVVEASSYQLARIETFGPRIGVVTNLAPDHLDRYERVERYYADKARLFLNARPDSVWVLNADDEDVLDLAGHAPGRRLLFGLRSRPDPGQSGAWLDADGRMILRADGSDQVVAHERELRLAGPHNRANALASLLAAHAAGVRPERLVEGLRSFAPPPHRLEPVGEVDGVLYVNDSKATNVAAARVAIASMDRPVVLLLGGKDKGEDFGPLGAALRAAEIRAVVTFGEAAERIEAGLAGRAAIAHEPGSFREVVLRARALARPGDVVLLAPACASFDMFEDFEDRGRRFAELVDGLARASTEVDRG